MVSFKEDAAKQGIELDNLLEDMIRDTLVEVMRDGRADHLSG